jgi:hypothetical protein
MKVKCNRPECENTYDVSAAGNAKSYCSHECRAIVKQKHYPKLDKQETNKRQRIRSKRLYATDRNRLLENIHIYRSLNTEHIRLLERTRYRKQLLLIELETITHSILFTGELAMSLVATAAPSPDEPSDPTPIYVEPLAPSVVEFIGRDEVIRIHSMSDLEQEQVFADARDMIAKQLAIMAVIWQWRREQGRPLSVSKNMVFLLSRIADGTLIAQYAALIAKGDISWRKGTAIPLAHQKKIALEKIKIVTVTDTGKLTKRLEFFSDMSAKEKELAVDPRRGVIDVKEQEAKLRTPKSKAEEQTEAAQAELVIYSLPALDDITEGQRKKLEKAGRRKVLKICRDALRQAGLL